MQLCIRQNMCHSPDELMKIYSKDINMERLNIQLQVLPQICSKDRSSTMAEVLQDIKNAINSGGSVVWNMLSEVITLFRLYLTVPVTTASAERTFSVLRRTKSFLRTTMSQNRLNAAMLCTVHRKRTDNISVENIEKEFCESNDRWKNYFKF